MPRSAEVWGARSATVTYGFLSAIPWGLNGRPHVTDLTGGSPVLPGANEVIALKHEVAMRERPGSFRVTLKSFQASTSAKLLKSRACPPPCQGRRLGFKSLNPGTTQHRCEFRGYAFSVTPSAGTYRARPSSTAHGFQSLNATTALSAPTKIRPLAAIGVLKRRMLGMDTLLPGNVMAFPESPSKA